MNQQNNEADLVAQAAAAQNMPEVLNIFDGIEKIKGNLPEEEEIIQEEVKEPEEEENQEVEETQDQQDESEEVREPEEEEEITLKSPSKDKKIDKYRKLQNDKYRALAEKEEALQKLAEMEAMLEKSLSSGTYHYGRNVYSELDKAKSDFQKSFNEGDEKGLLDAQLALIKAQTAISDLEKWAAENDNKKYYQNNDPVPDKSYQPNNTYQESLYQEIANDWLDLHPYLKPHSRNYDPKLAGDVNNFITRLDNNLHRNNNEDAIFSEEYFYTIDNYIKSLTTPKRDNSKNIESVSNVGGVRSSSSAGMVSRSQPKVQIKLTRDEEILADNSDVPREIWLQNKIEELTKRR